MGRDDRNEEEKPTDPDDIELPDAREVNRAERARRKAEKERERRKQTGVGTAAKLLDSVCKRHPGDPHRQAAAFLRQVRLLAGVGRPREVSEKTRTVFGDLLHRWISDLTKVNCRIQNIREMRRVHALRVLRLWIAQGNGPATLQTKISFMRRFFALTGRPEVLPVGREWTDLLRKEGIDPVRLERQQVAVESKSWAARGLDPLTIIETIRREHPVVATQMELQIGFGLRINESMQFEPFQCNAGTKILVIRGTKGGRHRSVDLDPDPNVASWQCGILDRAEKVARRHEKRRVATPGLTLAQSRNQYMHVMRKFGITKAEMGVTSHGLRHQFAGDRFKRVSGLPPPVEGEVPSAEYKQDPESLGEAVQHVTEQLGHARRSITGAYLGSVPRLAKTQELQLRTYLAQLEREDASAHLVSAGATDAWITGRAAHGLGVGEDDAMDLAVRFRADERLKVDTVSGLESALNALFPFRVKVQAWLDAWHIPEGAEVRISASGGDPHPKPSPPRCE